MRMLILVLLGLLGLSSSGVLGLHFGVQNPSTTKFCLILEASEVKGELHYVNKKNISTSVDFTIPDNTATTLNKDGSSCVDPDEAIQLDFVPEGPKVPETETQYKWSVWLQFAKSGQGEQQRYMLQNYSLTVHFYSPMNSSEQNLTIPHVYYKPQNFVPEWAAAAPAPMPNGFVCSQNQLQLDGGSSLQFNKLKVVAFTAQNTTIFDAHQAFEQCALDVRTSDIVPIIVGACLAGLVIVVLVAYLIGRARAKRQGYASV